MCELTSPTLEFKSTCVIQISLYDFISFSFTQKVQILVYYVIIDVQTESHSFDEKIPFFQSHETDF